MVTTTCCFYRSSFLCSSPVAAVAAVASPALGTALGKDTCLLVPQSVHRLLAWPSQGLPRMSDFCYKQYIWGQAREIESVRSKLEAICCLETAGRKREYIDQQSIALITGESSQNTSVPVKIQLIKQSIARDLHLVWRKKLWDT